MHRRTPSVCILGSILSLLIGCTEVRHETPDFFESKTGIPICSDARISNFQVGDHDYETDFTYGVTLQMSDECKDELSEQIGERLGVKCNLSQCNFMDGNNWSYEISTLANGELEFILRAI